MTTTHEDARVAKVLQELKSMWSDLTGQIRKLGADLTDFQQDTNASLAKIESVMSIIDEIDNLKIIAQELDEEVDRIQVSLTSTVEAFDSKMGDSGFKNFSDVTENLRINWST